VRFRKNAAWRDLGKKNEEASSKEGRIVGLFLNSQSSKSGLLDSLAFSFLRLKFSMESKSRTRHVRILGPTYAIPCAKIILQVTAIYLT
jgi:hypothetical protein